MRSRTRRDLVVAGAFVAVGAVFAVAGRELDLWTDRTPGPGFFPLLVEGLVVAFAVLLAATALRRRAEPDAGGTAVAREDTAPDDAPTAVTRLRRAGGVWLVLVVGVALTGLIGFLLAMIVVAALLLLVVERSRSIGSLVTVVALPAACYLLFAVLLDVRLPTGPFGF